MRDSSVNFLCGHRRTFILLTANYLFIAGSGFFISDGGGGQAPFGAKFLWNGNDHGKRTTAKRHLCDGTGIGQRWFPAF